MEDDLLAFARGSIRSIWTMELLVLMQRTPDKSWTVEELDRELRASAQVVRRSLSALIEAGLVETTRPQGYRYQPRNEILAQLAERVTRAYSEKPLSLVQALFAPGDTKLQKLANAFLFKKPES